MPIEREKIRQALLKKGFREKPNDHCFFHLYIKEKKQNIFTYLSYGSGYKDYGDELIHKVAHEIGLVKSELIDFVECKLKPEQHIELLKQRNRLR